MFQSKQEGFSRISIPIILARGPSIPVDKHEISNLTADHKLVVHLPSIRHHVLARLQREQLKRGDVKHCQTSCHLDRACHSYLKVHACCQSRACNNIFVQDTHDSNILSFLTCLGGHFWKTSIDRSRLEYLQESQPTSDHFQSINQHRRRVLA